MMADKILVMQHGRITEMGNHEELMAKKDIITNWYSCRPAKTWYRGETMAKNTYKQDEILEEPFDIRHLLRASSYIKNIAGV